MHFITLAFRDACSATISLALVSFFFFFFNDTATTEIYTLSLHDALPICWRPCRPPRAWRCPAGWPRCGTCCRDRKSTRLNSSHTVISYAVFCLKKKTTIPMALPSLVAGLLIAFLHFLNLFD